MAKSVISSELIIRRNVVLVDKVPQDQYEAFCYSKVNSSDLPNQELDCRIEVPLTAQEKAALDVVFNRLKLDGELLITE